jgi:hypothetical protein
MVCDPDFDSISGPVETMTVYAGSLYLGGVFDYSIGSGQTFGSSLLRYDGQDLTPLCCVFGQTFLYGVKALDVFDRGSGAELVVAGEFTNPANGIASWNGSTWSAFGSGLGGFFNPVTALAVFNPGSGAELYAGLGAGVVRWNGTSWSSIGASDAGIESLFSYSDGTPTMLYTGGRFSTIGGVSASRIARWDGSAWATVGNGVTAPATNASVLAMTSFDDHSAGDADLYIAGSFAEVGGVTSPNIAEWSACGTLTGTAFCFGDGSLATPCPCAAPNVVPNPAAALRHGCANSFNFDGAQLYASGSTANDGVQFMTSGQTPFGFSFFIVGTAQDSNGVASADGVRCVDGALTRFGSQFAACGSVVYPNSLVGWTAPVSVVSGATPGSGLTKYYQVYYRNAAANFCTGATTNFTSAYRLVW